MADKKVTIKVDLDAEPSIAQLRKLKAALKETAAGSEDFNKIKAAMNDVEDALKSAKTGADNFAEIVGELPGPVGELGNKVGGTIATLKQFGGIKLDALKNSFTELGKDLVDVGKGIGNLTGLSKVYTVATNGASKALQFFGVSAEGAATASKTFGLAISGLLAATGLIALTALIQMTSEAWENYSKKAERAEEAQKKLNESLLKGAKAALDAESASVKRTGDLLVAEAKARGANAAEIYKIEQQNRKLLLQSQERYYNELKDKDSDEARSALSNIKDTQNQIKIADANFKADQLEKNNQHTAQVTQKNQEELKQIAKDREDARIKLLSAEEAEVANIERNYKVKIDLAKKHGENTKDLEKAQAKEIKAVRDRYRKDENEAMKKGLIDDLQTIIDGNKEQYEKEKLQLDLQKAKGLIDEETYQQSLYDIRVKYANSDADLINAQIDNLNYLSDKKKDNLEKDKEWADKQKEYNKVIAESWIDLGRTTADTFAKLGGLFEEGSDAAKAFGIASVLIGAATSIAQINFRFAEGIADARSTITKGQAIAGQGLSLLGNPVTALLGASMITSGTAGAGAGTALLTKLQLNKGLQIAGVVATSAAQIAAITSAKGKSGGGASSGGGVDAGATGAPAPVYSGAATSMASPQIQTTNAVNPSTQIAQTITGAREPLRAYVVSGEISSAQALDRRTNRAATFSGG